MHDNKQFILALISNTLVWTSFAAAFFLSTTLFYTTTQLLNTPELTQAITTRQTTDIITLQPIVAHVQIRFLLALGTFLLFFFIGLLFYTHMALYFCCEPKANCKNIFAGKLMLFFVPFTLSFFVGNKLLPTLTLLLTLVLLFIAMPVLARTALQKTPPPQSLQLFLKTLPKFILLFFILLIGNTFLLFILPPTFFFTSTFITFIVWNTLFHKNYLTQPCAHK